ncbi:Oxo-4-hydroxy-4-carboxy-5-ureidoimidazoline decarboxylase [Xylaria sp. FL0933]|nr:Oxo-4-hydroxy-4-carboxy-5-ureidoimidazoline decarboxylase [Xylaria sp. FL0933]
MAATPNLPPISSLPTADEETLKSVLDTLFEPSPEIHAIAIPVIQRRKRIPANPGLTAELAPPPVPPHTSSSLSSAPPTIPDETPFTSYASLIQHIGTLLHQLAISSSFSSSSSPSSSPAREKLHAILGSHPRLGAKKVDSAQSRAEQAQLNTGDAAGADEAERLAALNREYEERFPGLRYVVFVNGRSRDVIMEDMRRRIDRGDTRAEEREGIQAMVDIALDRAKKLGSAS